ncbi:MAG: TadE-like protein [Gemmataceae bacterium]|nr:TadE-like protein [Gemmataceae bacterium]
MRRRQYRPRHGVASVELAVVFLFFLIPLMIAVWEVGRLVQVQQIVSNAAREGARLAAQGNTINSTGSATQIMVSTGTPNVHDVVYQYLYAAGLTNLSSSDVTVTFTFTPTSGYPSGLTDPYQGVKNQPFTVTVSIPWNRVRWVNLGLINPTTVDFTVSWQMLVDDLFTVNQTLPSW